MKLKLETYRGWEISFDTENENFYCISNEYDKDKAKKTYALAKKYIDDYIKENIEFKPVFVQSMPSIFSEGELIRLIGIRKDGAFMCERNGKKEQLSSYSEDKYFLVDTCNDEHFLAMSKLRDERTRLDNEIKLIEAKVTKTPLSEIKEKYLPTSNS